MTDIGKIYSELGTDRDGLVSNICAMNDANEYLSPIPTKELRLIAEKLVDEVAEDIYVTADREYWCDDDLRLAFGRVLLRKLDAEI